MYGDHSSLNVQGAWASVKRPMTLMSTPARAIQAGIAIQTRPRGRPEEKDSRTTERSRRLRTTSRRAAPMPEAADGAVARAPFLGQAGA